MYDTRPVAYTIMFSTTLSREEIEEKIDELFRDIATSDTISYIEEISEEDRIKLCEKIVEKI